MAEAPDLRIDATGTTHPLGRRASQELRARAGEWRLLPAPGGILLAVRAGGATRPLRLAGEVRVPGGLCDVVSTISQGGYSGELTVYEAETVRSILFDHGNVVGAASTAPGERLGEILWRFGAITRGQLDEVVSAAERTGKRFGETAIELEFVEPEELFLMMGCQVEEIFYAAAHLGEATFFLFDGLDEKLALRQPLSTGQLLMEAARRMDELRFFREKIPNAGWIPTHLAPSPGRNATPELAKVLEQCDGRRSIAEIGRRIGQLEFEVTRAVFQLATAGLVGVVPPRPEGPAAVVEAFDRALVEIHRACDAAGKGGELRSAVEQFATTTGVFVPLLDGAGPLPDGSLRPERVARNVASVTSGEEDREAWLVQQLFEYAGFALFHAGSLLPREQEQRVNARVAEILKPLRQQPEGGPPSRRSPSTIPASLRGDPLESR
jgi:hypothetical protein